MYYLKEMSLAGDKAIVVFDREQSYYTQCTHCGKEIKINYDDFWDMIHEYGIGMTLHYCNSSCAAIGRVRDKFEIIGGKHE